MKDTSNADLTIKATGYQWKWGYDYLKGEGEGIGFLSTLDVGAPRDVRQRQAAAGRRLPAQGRQPAGGAGRQEDPHHHHRQRRDPRLDGAGLRRQAGRDPRLRARHLVPRREDRRLLRPVRRAVRQGTRLHADPREGGVAGRTTPPGSTARRRRWPPRPTTRPRSGTLADLVARGEKVYAANCAACHQASGKGAGPIKALDGSPVVLDADKAKQIAIAAQRRRTTARCRPGSSCRDTEIAAVDHLHQEQLVATRPASSCSRPKSSPPASKPRTRRDITRKTP